MKDNGAEKMPLTPDIEASPASDKSNSQANSTNFDFNKYVPYQLESKNRGLFPEFYHYFKKNFSNESEENQAYCSRNLDELTSHEVDDKNDTQSTLSQVEADFESKFRQCLHPDLLNDFIGWKFTRKCVETQFREKLDEKKDYVSASIRLEQLNQQSRKDWRVEPLIDFLTAFGHTESSIWTHLIQAYAVGAVNNPKNRDALNAAAEWQTEPVSFSRRTSAFADSYRAHAVIYTHSSPEEKVEKVIFVILYFGLLSFIVWGLNWLMSAGENKGTVQQGPYVHLQDMENTFPSSGCTKCTCSTDSVSLSSG